MEAPVWYCSEKIWLSYFAGWENKKQTAGKIRKRNRLGRTWLQDGN